MSNVQSQSTIASAANPVSSRIARYLPSLLLAAFGSVLWAIVEVLGSINTYSCSFGQGFCDDVSHVGLNPLGPLIAVLTFAALALFVVSSLSAVLIWRKRARPIR
jgi:hypothetical protein